VAEMDIEDVATIADYVEYTRQLCDDYRSAGYRVSVSLRGVRVDATKTSSREQLKAIRDARQPALP